LNSARPLCSDSTSVNIITLAFISSSIIVFLNLHPINAQEPTTTSLITYQNPSLGFSIQHPADWKVEDSTYERGIRFTTPDGSIPILHIRSRDVNPYLDTNTMTLKNKTLEQVVQEYLSNISRPNPIGLESQLIRQNQVTVGDNLGWKIEMLMGPKTDPYYYLFLVLTIANGKLYSLEYNERPLNVPTTLPLVQKMVDSFQILSVPACNFSKDNDDALGKCALPTGMQQPVPSGNKSEDAPVYEPMTDEEAKIYEDCMNKAAFATNYTGKIIEPPGRVPMPEDKYSAFQHCASLVD